ncbi:Crp/Fnr family transcriptional regulator [Dinghuibacter silviterrae]|uniref:CRP-like cAMP-binding protein n=1 Tax=Dinghuibacter silviterrae TaxID=1539049 RepID=A0A4R8DIV5_9BACT|nr:Crp/Fnr family transcriptional regulator [Dinghuibacter silviterrae]TDW97448.1 CRP-like cAMP-binding protein [Dinghuibacter silviterrae]
MPPIFDHFKTFTDRETTLTPEELQQVWSLATVKELRRRQPLWAEGEVCRHKLFVAKGLLRAFCLKSDGSESILAFSPENSWFTDPESLKDETPSRLTVEAIEDTTMLLWTKEHFGRLLETIPALKSYFEKLIVNTLYLSRQRILENISYTTEEKYREFMESFPDVFQRVPLHMVASYLGVTRETLSRIRQAQLRQQKVVK